MQYIIGIGANIGFTIENICKAIDKISSNTEIHITKQASLYSSQAHLKDDSPTEWDICYINTAVKINSSLEPIALLKTLKNIEIEIGRDLNAPEWSPRLIDLDILSAEDIFFDSVELTIPHKELLNRSFAMTPLLEIDPLWRHPSFTNIDLHKKLIRLDNIHKLNQNSHPTIIMGIVNLSTQSFSDGHFDDDKRKMQVMELIDQGAECIDIGAESTKPTAIPMSIDHEWELLDNFLYYIKYNINEFKYKPLISIDTRKLQVMHKVLDKYHEMIWMINDVEGNDIEDKANLIAKFDKKYVITHNLGIVDRTKYLTEENAIDDICDFVEVKKQKLLNAGVTIENIYFDVGIGFGKHSETAKIILSNITDMKKRLGLKTLFAHSRKPSILGLPKTATVAELDVATKIMSAKLQDLGIDIIRVHRI